MSERPAAENGEPSARETRGSPRDGRTQATATDPSELTYIESQIIMTTVKVVAPFSLTYGLFLMFHGADTPGGSFQGGAIIGSTILMVAFAFGIAPTRDWLRNRTVVALAAGGTAAFTIVGLIPMAFGGNFLAHPVFEEQFGINTKWGLEAIEILGVAPIVAGVVIGLFFVIAAGVLGEPAQNVRTDGGNAETGANTVEAVENTGEDEW